MNFFKKTFNSIKEKAREAFLLLRAKIYETFDIIADVPSSAFQIAQQSVNTILIRIMADVSSRVDVTLNDIRYEYNDVFRIWGKIRQASGTKKDQLFDDLKDRFREIEGPVVSAICMYLTYDRIKDLIERVQKSYTTSTYELSEIFTEISDLKNLNGLPDNIKGLVSDIEPVGKEIIEHVDNFKKNSIIEKDYSMTQLDNAYNCIKDMIDLALGESQILEYVTLLENLPPNKSRSSSDSSYSLCYVSNTHMKSGEGYSLIIEFDDDVPHTWIVQPGDDVEEDTIIAEHELSEVGIHGSNEYDLMSDFSAGIVRETIDGDYAHIIKPEFTHHIIIDAFVDKPAAFEDLLKQKVEEFTQALQNVTSSFGLAVTWMYKLAYPAIATKKQWDYYTELKYDTKTTYPDPIIPDCDCIEDEDDEDYDEDCECPDPIYPPPIITVIRDDFKANKKLPIAWDIYTSYVDYYEKKIYKDFVDEIESLDIANSLGALDEDSEESALESILSEIKKTHKKFLEDSVKYWAQRLEQSETQVFENETDIKGLNPSYYYNIIKEIDGDGGINSDFRLLLSSIIAKRHIIEGLSNETYRNKFISNTENLIGDESGITSVEYYKKFNDISEITDVPDLIHEDLYSYIDIESATPESLYEYKKTINEITSDYLIDRHIRRYGDIDSMTMFELTSEESNKLTEFFSSVISATTNSQNSLDEIIESLKELGRMRELPKPYMFIESDEGLFRYYRVRSLETLEALKGNLNKNYNCLLNASGDSTSGDSDGSGRPSAGDGSQISGGNSQDADGGVDSGSSSSGTEHLNKPYSGITSIPIYEYKYWVRHFLLDTAISVPHLVTWFKIGAVSVPLPVIYVPILVFKVKSLLTVIGVGIAGLGTFPLVLFVNLSDKPLSYLTPLVAALDKAKSVAEQTFNKSIAKMSNKAIDNLVSYEIVGKSFMNQLGNIDSIIVDIKENRDNILYSYMDDYRDKKAQMAKVQYKNIFDEFPDPSVMGCENK